MTKDEALKMAIEALNQAAEWLAGDDKFDVYNLDKAYFACKEALEQPAFGECGNKACGGHGACYCEEQPAQEPVATIQQFERKWIDKEALEQPAQEPVAWIDEFGVIIRRLPIPIEGITGTKFIPLYTHPHQWQGLTDDEIEYWECLKAPPVHPDFLEDDSWREFARCIEQELKTKNGFSDVKEKNT